jgi:hypothetical protein
LKALTFIPKGNCWNGGGLFTGRHQFWLNGGYGHQVERESKEIHRDWTYQPQGGVGNECLSVYYPRLLRDGWISMGHGQVHGSGRWPTTVDVFEKPVGGGWVLRKFAYAGIETKEGVGCYWDEHELSNPHLEAPIRRTAWEWADIHDSRLVWAETGTIRTAKLNQMGLTQEKVLADFNAMQFEAIAAPY